MAFFYLFFPFFFFLDLCASQAEKQTILSIDFFFILIKSLLSYLQFFIIYIGYF